MGESQLRLMKYLIILLSIALMLSCNKTSNCPTLVGYTWEFVQIVGGNIKVIESGVVRCEDDPSTLFDNLKYKHKVYNNSRDYTIKFKR